MNALDRACLGVANAKVAAAKAGLDLLAVELSALADAFATTGPSDLVVELRRQARAAEDASEMLPNAELVINADGSVEYSPSTSSAREP